MRKPYALVELLLVRIETFSKLWTVEQFWLFLDKKKTLCDVKKRGIQEELCYQIVTNVSEIVHMTSYEH